MPTIKDKNSTKPRVNPPYGHGLLDHHAALLTASAISEGVAAERGYRSVETKADMVRLGFAQYQANAPALLVPMRGVVPERMGYQVRPDTPRVKDGKRVKYETPAGQPNFIDVHPRILKNLGDPSIPLYVTEGARKQDSAVSQSLTCISLTGVYGWRGANDVGGTTALPDWKSIALQGRVVILAFDSDVMTKWPVYEALERLKRWLEMKGATVRIAYLPMGDDGAKAGLDDYFAAGHTVADLEVLVTDELRAPPAAPKPTHDGPVVELAPLLEDMGRFVQKYVVLTPAQRRTVALWIAHTWAIRAFDVTPYLYIWSAEKQSGKTRLEECTSMLACKPWLTARVSSAVLVRRIERDCPTLILDEVDAAFGSGDEYVQDLRGILDAGYKRSGVVSRLAGGDSMELKDFHVFCPKAFGGIGKLPDTIADRSIPIEMRRKLKSEVVFRFRYDDVGAESAPLRERLQAWAERAIEMLKPMRVDALEQLDDRAAEVWEPLLAIASLAGEASFTQARLDAIALSGDDAKDDESIGTRLLKDIREVFGSFEARSSADLVALLAGLPESPWGTWAKGKPITQRHLANLLKPYRVFTQNVKTSDGEKKGYRASSFTDSFARYLPGTSIRPSVGNGDVTPETGQLISVGETLCDGCKKPLVSHDDATCNGCTDKNPEEAIATTGV